MIPLPVYLSSAAIGLGIYLFMKWYKVGTQT